MRVSTTSTYMTRDNTQKSSVHTEAIYEKAREREAADKVGPSITPRTRTMAVETVPFG